VHSAAWIGEPVAADVRLQCLDSFGGHSTTPVHILAQGLKIRNFKLMLRPITTLPINTENPQ
jgi:hypothetical protein